MYIWLRCTDKCLLGKTLNETSTSNVYLSPTEGNGIRRLTPDWGVKKGLVYCA